MAGKGDKRRPATAEGQKNWEEWWNKREAAKRAEKQNPSTTFTDGGETEADTGPPAKSVIEDG